MKHFFFFFLISIAPLCHARQLFVGILEADSYNDVKLSISALAGVTRIKDLNSFCDVHGAKLTGLPVMRGFEADKRIRIIQTIDPEKPLSEINPANTAIFVTRDGGQTIKNMLEKNYRNHRYWRSGIRIYDKPLTTNLAAEVAYMQESKYILTSRNRNAMLWMLQNSKLLNAAPLKQQATLKLLLNPQRAAAVLETKADTRILKLFKPAEIMQELEKCLIGVNIDPQVLTVNAEIRPLTGTPVASLIESMSKTETTPRDISPPDSLIQSITCNNSPEIWDRFAPNMQNYLLPALKTFNHEDLFTGQRIQYSAPKGKDLVFVQADDIKNKTNVIATINSLENAMPSESVIGLQRVNPDPEKDLVRYKFILKEKAETKSQNTVYYTIASLLLQRAYLEMKVVDNTLISVIGPENSLQDVTARLKRKEKDMTLLKEISARNNQLSEKIICGTKFRVSQALRETISVIPNVTREQLAILPEPGYGITVGLEKPENGTLKASMQIYADEIAALNHIGDDVRKLMQKIMVSMLMKSIEDTDVKQDAKK
ncbi:MAG: hypothetical protein R6V06_09530 [Kiritimatiellia bacterium]